MTSAGEPLGLGIDVGGTKILAGAVSAAGEVVAEIRYPSPLHAEDLGQALTSAFDTLAVALAERTCQIAGIGLALPGLIRPDGVLLAAPNLGAADVGIEIGPRFGEPLQSRVTAAGGSAERGIAYDNDATCAAYAEATIGGAAGAGNTVVISIGTGIGAGVVADGRVVRGAHGFAGEIGHMVVDPDGPPCPCGRRGCWERYASGPGLAELARCAQDGADTFAASHTGSGNGGALRAEDVVAAARAGEKLAQSVIEEFARYVALGLSNTIELLDPAQIVLGGGLMQAADVLLEPIRRAYVATTRPAHQRDGSDIVLATLGDRAAMIGAGLLGLGRLGE